MMNQAKLELKQRIAEIIARYDPQLTNQNELAEQIVKEIEKEKETNIGRWTCEAWNNGKVRTFITNKTGEDPFDSRFIVDRNGSNMTIDGKGVATLDDSTRLFVSGPWTNTKMKAEFFVSPSTIGVISMRSRSNHETKCCFGDYLVRWDIGGKNQVRTGKEPVHPLYIGYHGVNAFECPRNTWFELKQITKTVGDTVVVQGYVDGKMATSGIDDGNWPGIPKVGQPLWKTIEPCKGKGDRIPENLDKPFLGPGNHCWIRCDINTAHDALKVRNYTVKEI